MSVGGVGGARTGGGVAGARGSSALAGPTLTADDGGNLQLQPPANTPIHISKGNEGRYHVSMGADDVAFTPEQMKRLNIKAGAGNPVTVGADVDAAFKVNGRPAGNVQGRGFESVPGMDADRYEAARKPPTSTPSSSSSSTPAASAQPGPTRAGGAAPEAARGPDASRAVKSHNWDSVGVPDRVDAKAETRGAAQHKADAAGNPAQKAAQKPEVEKPGEQKKQEKLDEEDKKKKGPQVQFTQLMSPTGEDKVDVQFSADVIRVEQHVSMELWKKMFANMGGGGGSDVSSMMGAAQSEIAGVRAQSLQSQVDALRDPSPVPPSNAAVNTDNNLDRR